MSPEHGKILEFFVKEGGKVTIGSKLFKMDTIDENSASLSESDPVQNISRPTKPTTISTPDPKLESVRSVAKEPSVKEPNATKEEHSRSIVKEDIKSELNKTEDRTLVKKKLSLMRAKIASHLKESQNTNASLTTFNEIDMSSLIDFRNIHKDSILKSHGVKFGFMSPFIMASARILQEIPMLNSRIEGSEVVTPSFVDISVAVATPKGLVTPVIRDCQTIAGFLDIEKKLANLADLAKSNALTQNHLKGGTFTISNGGVFGSLNGTPIINLPQSAILGMHAIKERAVVVNGEVKYLLLIM